MQRRPYFHNSLETPNERGATMFVSSGSATFPLRLFAQRQANPAHSTHHAGCQIDDEKP